MCSQSLFQCIALCWIEALDEAGLENICSLTMRSFPKILLQKYDVRVYTVSARICRKRHSLTL